MPKLNQQKQLPYPAEFIYELVLDIEKYPEFLPWCKNAKITKEICDGNLEADLLVNFKNILEKYKSDVKFGNDDGVYFINSVAIEGPFKKLENLWKIKAINENSCLVNINLEFEFNSIFLSKMIGLVFTKASEKMMKAFEDRAKLIFK